MENATTILVSEVMTTVSNTIAATAPFNTTPVFISIGVLGGFVLGLVVYGIAINFLGKLSMPVAEDKEPLADGNGNAPTSSTEPQATTSSSMDKNVDTNKASGPSTIITEQTNGKESIAPGQDTTIEVYEQNVDVSDENTLTI
ncbi:uncharacterized protein [Diadema antillarum]|uniref:uncharacterized protein n=1 Tax=Diadema antillarum TaxID=105358 RepID=UPI003A8492BA